MPSLPFHYVTTGQYAEALQWTMTEYVGYGMLWLFFGAIIFGAVWVKTKSYGIAGLVFMIYSGLIGVLLPKEMQLYVMLIIGVMLAAMVIKMVIK